MNKGFGRETDGGPTRQAEQNHHHDRQAQPARRRQHILQTAQVLLTRLFNGIRSHASPLDMVDLGKD